MRVMRSARVHGPGSVSVDAVPVPAIGAGDVLVRVRACGICGSDLGYIAAGGLGGGVPLAEPLTLGHEFAGVVEAVGPGVDGVEPGLRIAVNPDAGFIGGGGPDGAMAPLIRVQAAALGSTLFALPDHVSDEQGALAEPLSVALHGLRMVDAKPGDKVAVLGAGPIGLCAVAMLRHLGMRDIAIVDRVQSRLDRALALGATLAVNTAETDLADALAGLHGEGERFGTRFVGTDLFVDAAGAAPLLTDVIAVAKLRARISVIALYKKPAPIDLWKVMANEIMLTGSIALDRADEFGEALAMIGEGKVDLAPMVSHRFAFDRFDEAIAVAGDADRSAKVMLHFDGEPA
ncbi:Threonine dehydrogenase [Sphingomonas jatrophae]|uniref:Threonine dehydrogenase n=2 Tax=Sphingomonas jatrophae TaxID=1166337 RepID=A0A1I6KHD9_9SPHN|nr:Threonine dehydrogenase [Sphingomonas jatrophae]